MSYNYPIPLSVALGFVVMVSALAAVAMIVLGFGLFCLAVILTLATLMPYFSVGVQTALMRAWQMSCGYVAGMITHYFKRTRWFGHTKSSTTAAVACGLAMWIAVLGALAFPTYWRISIAMLLALPIPFLAAAWFKRGRRAHRHTFRFACAFFEPAAILVAQQIGSKLIDLGLDTLRAVL